MSNIEWTDKTRVHTMKHATDTRGRTEDRCEEGRLLGCRVRTDAGRRPEVVHRLQGVAPERAVHDRSKSMGRHEAAVPGVVKGKVRPQAQDAKAWPVVRSCTRRRPEAGSASSQLLCRDRSPGSPEHAAVRRLRACVRSRGASS